jgi:hypothetical protein
VGPALAFLAPTLNVTITAGQSFLVTSQRAFGGGTAAAGLGLWICYQTGGTGPLFQTGFGAMGLQVPAGARVNFPMTAVLRDLPAGTYTVGLCGSSGLFSAWAGSDPNGSTSVMVF